MSDRSPSEPSALLLAMRGWSRGCAALARREFARSLGVKRMSREDLARFAGACALARSGVTAATIVASLLVAARAPEASADVLRPAGAKPAPGGATGGGTTQGALAAARERQAALVNRSREALARTTAAVQSLRLAQQAARQIALVKAGGQNPFGIADGLNAGGLVVAAGATPGSTLWQNALAPTQTTVGDRTKVEIVQTGAKAILTWDGFNVGINTDLRFDQSAGGADASRWIALNRVTDASLNPSQILGNIKAEGQVYIVNPNGIIFHGTSRVDAHTLLASGLDFRGDTVAERDAAFRLGLAADDNLANPTLGIAAGSGAPVGDIAVRAGAQIVSGPSGAIFLTGGRVENAGTLESADGQVVLAAGERVWITKNTLGRTTGAIDTEKQIDKDLRGVRATVQDGGEIVQSGLIETLRGNTTLSGRDILHSGVTHATTGTTANGSITVLAGDAAAPSDIYWMWPRAFGSFTLASGSLLAISPDATTDTAFANQFRPGKIDLYARTAVFETGSRVHAPGANMAIVARTHTAADTAATDPSRIYLASGAEIDLAGLAGVEVAMSRNTVTANLRLDELKDSPLLRESPLRGAEIKVDLRRGTTLADLSGYYGLIEYGVRELMTEGGSLKLDSGSVITRAGSRIDLSGGSVTHLAGTVESSRLRGADGRIYDIATARNDIAYAGVHDTVTRMEAGYDEGRAAGTLRIGPTLSIRKTELEALNLTAEGTRPYFFAFEGELAATTVAGRHQTLAPDANATPQTAWRTLARAATLETGYELDTKIYGPSVRIGAGAALPADFAADSPIPAGAPAGLTLPARFFDGATLGHLVILSNIGGGDLTVDAGVTVNLGAHGSLNFHGSRATIDGAIVAPGGAVAILTDLASGRDAGGTGVSPDWAAMPESLRPGIRVGASGRIDAAGDWINTRLDGELPGARVVDGGSVSLKSAYELTLAPGARIDVRGGAELTSLNALRAGDAGSILLQNDLIIESANGFGGTPPTRPVGAFDIRGAELLGHAIGRGGALAIGTSRRVLVSADAPESVGATDDDTLVLRPGFFRTGGFLHRTVAGSGEMRVSAGTVIALVAESLLPTAALWTLPTGADLGVALTTAARPLALRDAGSITLAVALRGTDGTVLSASANPALLPGLAGPLVIETDARIETDPGSAISLYSAGDMFIDGTLSAPGGAITLGLSDAPTSSALMLGGRARLLAAGYRRETPVDGVAVRSVESAGTITLKVVKPIGNRTRIEADAGALLDVSGTAGIADLRLDAPVLAGGRARYLATDIAGDAGRIVVSGFRSGAIAARLDAHADSRAHAGKISITAGDLLDSSRTPIVVHATANATDFTPVTGTASVTGDGALHVAAPALNASGADTLELWTPASLAFVGDTALSARRELLISAPVVGTRADTPDARVDLAAASVRFVPYPGLGDSSLAPVPALPATPATLTGALAVRATNIDIVQTLDLGGAGLGGFADAHFESSGDIRLTVGNASSGGRVGRLYSAGALTLTSARTYATTAARHRDAAHDGFLVRSDRAVTLLRAAGDATSAVPFSYGETLTIAAPDITQAGVLRAPLGNIRLRATNSLTLAPGSVTSVSAEGLVMSLGAVAAGFVSPFPIPPEEATLANLLANHTLKSVTLDAPAVRLQTGAIVDVSGGGDLTGYEFIPGNGGSADILKGSGRYAVLPGYTAPAAPVVASGDLAPGSLRVGDAVRLDAAPGLAAGVYTLLPAHYALLPGAFMVQLGETGFATGSSAVALTDGSHLVSGAAYDRLTGTADAAVGRWRVTPGAVVRRYSEFNEYSYNAYLKSATAKAGVTTPRTGIDAGSVIVRVTDTLDLDGSGRFGAAAGGLAGRLDLAAQKIAVVADGAAAPDGYLAVEASALTRFGASALLLGGTLSADGERVTVTASDIRVENNHASALVAPEITLVATGAIRLADDAEIRGEGLATRGTGTLAIDGDGAALRVTSGTSQAIVRTGATGASGELILGERVLIDAKGSLTLDGSASVTNAASGVFTAPSITLSSALVSVGAVPSGTAGLILSDATLERFGRGGELLVRSHNTLDFHGAVRLGALDDNGRPVVGKLTLESAGLRGLGASGDTAVIAARELTLANTAGGSPAASGTGAGNLRIDAETLTLGQGVTTLAGFADADLHATRLIGAGKGGLRQPGTLTVHTAGLTLAKGADITLAADGALTLLDLAGASAATGGPGGRLTLEGASVTIDTTLDARAGIVDARAVSGTLRLGANADIRVGGERLAFFETARHADAGTVRLTADSGDLRLENGSRIDLAAHRDGGDAGTLELRATSGTATLDGALLGTASLTGAGASFSADLGTLADANALHRTLNASGFTASRSLRVRTGDLTLDAGERITAHEVTLRADTGRVILHGRVDAAADGVRRDGGRVNAAGGAGLLLGAGAVIDVSTAYAQSAAGFATASGRVSLTADGGDLEIAAGALIDTTGGERGGVAHFTALRDGADIRVTTLGATVRGARETALFGRAEYAATTATTAVYNGALADADTWMAGADAIAARLGGTAQVRPEILVRSTGDLTLANDLSLHTRRYAGATGSLRLESAGDLLVNASLSDGFASAASSAALLAGNSWNIRLDAGRDLRLGSGTVGRIVRTGTGDLSLSAGRDILFANIKTVAYTAGSKVADESGYNATGRLGDYPVFGGDLAVRAGRDILAPVTGDFITAWQFRYGRANTADGLEAGRTKADLQTGWSVVFANFEQGLGALGGGHASVRAGRDIRDLALMLPTTGQQTTAPGALIDPAAVVVRGGGNLDMRAGGDILGGVTLLGRGEARVNAGGDIRAGSRSLQRKTLTVTSAAAANYESRDLSALYALSDAVMTVSARGAVTIEAALDPMLIPSVAQNRTAANGNRITFFNSYTERTALEVTAVSGDITYLNNPWAGADLARGAVSPRLIHQLMSVPAQSSDITVISHDLLFAPGTLRFNALQGDITVAHRYATQSNHALRLAPTSAGNLELLATGDIRSNTPVLMMDIAPEYRRGAAAPFQNANPGPAGALTLAASERPGVTANHGRGNAPAHAGDAAPALLYALNGDIAGASELPNDRLVVQLPKAARVIAGGDIADTTFGFQHNADTAVSVVRAGRDVLRPDLRVMGGGELVVEAGRDIDLTSGVDGAIVTTGNLGNLTTTLDKSTQRLVNTTVNTALRNRGAGITLLAGAADADYAGFADKYVNPASATAVVRNYLPELRAFLGAPTETDAGTLLAAFAALPPERTRPFLLGLYFNELLETGLDVTNPDSPRFGDYARGFNATRALFGAPAAESLGDVRLYGRSLSTAEGGEIRVLAPRGELLVDVVTNPGAGSKGIVTQKGGAIRVMTHGDIALANSRIFTLQGGDVLMWTSVGDITAGAGSSTLAKPPALTYIVDADANVLLNAGSLQTGSGIGVLDANNTGLVDSRLDLIAPAGTVDAGDAGIRSAGKINIAAQVILGAANISAGGGVTGVSAAPSVNVAAAAAANASAATTGAGAANAAERAEQRSAANAEAPASLFSMEVLGFGDDEETTPGA